MSLTFRTIFPNKNLILTPRTHFTQSLTPNFLKSHFPNLYKTQQKSILSLVFTKPNNVSFQELYQTSQDRQTDFNLDSLLSLIEFLTLFSSLAVSVYVAVSVCVLNKVLGSKVLVLQCVVLVSGVVVGAVIRRRQWRRICGVGVSRSNSSSVNLLERVEKLEEDLRSSGAIIRVMSRQLEKLGIRFRVTRKTLKEPIAEAAALAQKNSEATRALAAQGEHLEKELGEIQKVLMAMQEQQQKQLELILAIAKAGKLWETKRTKIPDEKSTAASTSPLDGAANSDISHIETVALQKEPSNERP